jgi:hypothetical protein
VCPTGGHGYVQRALGDHRTQQETTRLEVRVESGVCLERSVRAAGVQP